MTIREFNKLRRAVYDQAMENQEIADAVNVCGEAFVWDVRSGDKHAFLVLSHKAQLNDNVLREHGICDGENAVSKLVLHLNRKTKCADF